MDSESYRSLLGAVGILLKPVPSNEELTFATQVQHAPFTRTTSRTVPFCEARNFL